MLLPNPPQFLYQAPPGAQQLNLPDFANVPHFEHVIGPAIVDVAAGVLGDLVIGSRDTSCLFSGRDRSETVSVGHTVCDIDPSEPVNMAYLSAFE